MNENTAVRLSPLSDYPIDRSDLFALCKLSLFEFIDQTFGWVENFQQSRFDASYPDEAFSVILLGAQAVGYVSQKSELDSLHLSLLLLQPAHRRRGVGTQGHAVDNGDGFPDREVRDVVVLSLQQASADLLSQTRLCHRIDGRVLCDSAGPVTLRTESTTAS